MPRHYPPEVRREACERMLAGEEARRHSALNYLTPIKFEDVHSTHDKQAVLS